MSYMKCSTPQVLYIAPLVPAIFLLPWTKHAIFHEHRIPTAHTPYLLPRALQAPVCQQPLKGVDPEWGAPQDCSLN